MKKESISDNELIRLNKFLSDAGVCSRREADKLVEKGLVYVDGKKAIIGQKVYKNQEIVLLAFNKPRGIICSTSDEQGISVVKYINYSKRIYPIGRLDKDSEGLLLLTNDGDISDRILRSRNNHEKEYIVTVNKNITDDYIKNM